MEKQIRKFKVDFDFDWTYDIKIDKLKEDIKKLEDLGVTELSIDPDEDYYYGNSIITIVALAERLETDEEAKKRIDKENKNREDSEKRDL